jgi:hypothetical protein
MWECVAKHNTSKYILFFKKYTSLLFSLTIVSLAEFKGLRNLKRMEPQVF